MFTFDPLPHAEAVSRIAKLPLVSREVMDGLLPELRAYAFTISGLDVGDQMAKVRDIIKAVPAGEKNWDKARKEIAAELADDLGGKAAQRRAELLLRTHVFRSYAASRYRNLMQQVDVFPFWQYRTHGDGRVRPSHAALNGKIFPAGHEIWQRIFPPWDWGCRCIVVPLTQRSAEGLAAAGKPSEQAAADANLLPTQISKPEIFTPQEADIISKNQRLPGGIPLNRTPTFSDSPWSIPGNVHHDWKLIQARYADQPEVLAAFKQWADKQEITPGKTVSMWIDDEKTFAAQPPKLTLKPQFRQPQSGTPTPPPPPTPAPAQRSMQDVHAALDAVKPEYQAAVKHAAQMQSRMAFKPLGSKAWAKAQADVDAAQAQLEAVKEKAREAISIPQAERGTVTVKSLQMQPQNLKDAVASVERFTHASLLPTVDVRITSGRAEAEMNGNIKIRLDQEAEVIAHEITHVTEYSSPKVLQASRDFLLSRRLPKEMPQHLQQLFPTTGFNPEEVVFVDSWGARGGHPYSGKLYFPGWDDLQQHPAWIAALKVDPVAALNQVYATELLTMGMERLMVDPVAFATLDPDYFAFTVSTLQQLTP